MKKQIHVTVPENGRAIYAACGFMLAAALLRLGYYLPMQVDFTTKLLHLWLPVTAAGLFLFGFAMGGGWMKPCAILAVAVGVAFFVLKARNFSPLHRSLCTLLYAAVLVLFTVTLLGLLPTKKLLYPLFGLPLLYHIFVEDWNTYFFADPPMPVRQWMPELSVLSIMAGLLCLSLSLKTEKV